MTVVPSDGGRAAGTCLPGIAVPATRARSFAFRHPTNCDSGQLNFLSLWDPLLAAVVDISLTSCQSSWGPLLSAGQ